MPLNHKGGKMQFKVIKRIVYGHTFMIVYPINFLSEYKAKQKLQYQINKYLKNNPPEQTDLFKK